MKFMRVRTHHSQIFYQNIIELLLKKKKYFFNLYDLYFILLKIFKKSSIQLFVLEKAFI